MGRLGSAPATVEEQALSLCWKLHIWLCRSEPSVAFGRVLAGLVRGIGKCGPNPLLNLTAYKFSIRRSS